MATFLSSPGPAGSRATPGERRFADRLRDLLEDDLCWYDVPVGPRHQHPDFLVLHPARGLLILEVKDWHLKTIRDADPVRFTIDTGAGHKVVPNPLEQARQYTFAVTDLLKQDPQLTNPAGSPYEGQLTFPYGYGVVLTNITRSQFESSGLADVLQPHLVLCKDELTESADAEQFQSRLWSMFNVRFQSKLTLPQVERIRWRLFPELRIHQQTLGIDPTDQSSVNATPADLLQVMDLAQEEIARNLGEGHRVIHGVAGSGKTLILAYRCRHLARTLHKPILVLVFNRSLAAWLRYQFDAQSIYGDKRAKSFSFRSLGIAAAGRTKILKRNYRNTREILTCARTFASGLLSARDADDDDVPLLFPEAGDRSGARPRFAELASMQQEAEHIARELQALHVAGVAWNEMGVFYTARFVAEEIAAALQAASIPFDWLKDAASKSFDPARNAVKLMTPHSSRGSRFSERLRALCA